LFRRIQGYGKILYLLDEKEDYKGTWLVEKTNIENSKNSFSRLTGYLEQKAYYTWLQGDLIHVSTNLTTKLTSKP